MTAFLIRRLAFAVVTLFTVLTLVFLLVRIVPGDPAQVILGDQAGREAIWPCGSGSGWTSLSGSNTRHS